VKYKLKWKVDYNSSSKEVTSRLNCTLEDHESIEAFSFFIREQGGNTGYWFKIKTITDRTGCKERYSYNRDKTEAIQKSVDSQFKRHTLKLNSWSDLSALTSLRDATKQSTIACARVLFTLISLSEEDQNKISEFLQTGIFPQEQLLEILLLHISKNKISTALDKATLLEKRGYNGILLKVLVKWLGDSYNIEANTNILNTMLEKSVSLNVIKYLLTLKIDWNYLNDRGQPLIHTALNHSPDAILFMIEAGANINQIDRYGSTMMHLIAAQDASNLQLTKLKSLFDCSANPTVRAPNSNMTPYQLAYMRQNHIIAQQIAEYTKEFKGHIDPLNTIEAQLEQIRTCQERERSRLQFDEKKILARLKELEIAQQQLQEEKIQLLAKLNHQPVSVGDYDRQDYAVIKAMLDFYTDKMAEFPSQVSELLQKVSVPSIKTESEMRQIIKTVFEGSIISDADKEELFIDLKEINVIAIKNRKQLKLRSQVEYKADDIANMVREAAKDLVLEKQVMASKMDVKSQQSTQSVVVTLKHTNSPVHSHSTSKLASSYTKPLTLEKKL
jgi:hypothetical protein